MTSERDPSDEDLVSRAKAGDEEAHRLLFERHLPRLRLRVRRRLSALLRRRVGESDVIQEAWATTSLRLADFEDRGGGSFGHWLDGIVENKIRDQIRAHVGTGRRDARREADEDAAALGAPSPGPSPSVAAVRAEDRDRLSAALDVLPPRYGELLRLVHMQGVTLIEAAARMGSTPNALSKVYARAVSRLAVVLEAGRAP
jgi:RNA polymerase sigma-70 factor (ECF subfamily)